MAIPTKKISVEPVRFSTARGLWGEGQYLLSAAYRGSVNGVPGVARIVGFLRAPTADPLDWWDRKLELVLLLEDGRRFRFSVVDGDAIEGRTCRIQSVGGFF